MRSHGLRRGLIVAAALAWSSVAAAGPQVAFDTTMGRIVVDLDDVRAPVTVRNFLAYVDEGHYDGTIVHRVVDGFVIQGGGLTPDMHEKATHAPIPNEAGNGLSNVAGTIAMAREEAVGSATAQWFINVADNTRLDHVDVPPEGVTLTRRGKDSFFAASDADKLFGYAVFGRVVAGMDVVERIRRVPVHTVEAGERYENVPVDPVVITKATLLPAAPLTALPPALPVTH
jgi:cyclophilin family peptidyl-prolyl cis-trans isomerase